MKLFDFTMGALLVAPLAMAGCPGDDSMAEGTTDAATGSTTSTTEMNTTMVADSSGGESSSGDPPIEVPDCNEQIEIPAAPVDCSGVDGVLDGSLILEPGGEGDPSMLDGIATVTGSIQLNGTDLTDLNFMACVQTVGGEINIFDNDMLTDVSGLWSVTDIGTHFVFSENGALEVFDGLPNIEVIGTGDADGAGNLVLKNNDSLTAVTGFNSLVGVNNNLTIQFNPLLQHIAGLGGLRVIGNLLAITANPELCISSVNCVGTGIIMPATPPDSWSTNANNTDC